MSIRARIILTHLLIVGIGFFYLVKKITDVSEIKPRYMQSIEEPMVDTARLLAALLESQGPGGKIDIALRARILYGEFSILDLVGSMLNSAEIDLKHSD